MPECAFPNCPSGANIKLLDDRHEEVKSHLSNIETSQKEMITIVTNIATLLADVQNIKKDLEKKDKEHNDIFARLRSIETVMITKTDLIGGVTIVTAIFTVVQIFFKFVI